MKKNEIILLLVSLPCIIANAQERITSILSDISIEKTHLVTYEGNNYIVSVTPGDIVSYFLLKDDQRTELVKSKHLPYAYNIKRSNMLVFENYFIMVTESNILRYKFDNDEISTTPINNYLPPNYGFEVGSDDNETIRFGLNGTGYIYNYRKDELFSANSNFLANYKNYAVVQENDPLEKIYKLSILKLSDTTKNLFLTIPSNRSYIINMYEDYLISPDSSGNVMKYYYDGSKDTLLNLQSKPNSLATVLETKNYYVSMNGFSTDFTTVTIYNKLTRQKIYSANFDKDLYLGRKRLKEISDVIVFLGPRQSLFIMNPIAQNTNILKYAQFTYNDTIPTLDNFVFYKNNYANDDNYYYYNVVTGESVLILRTKGIKSSYSYGNGLIKNFDKYYYNINASTVDNNKNLIKFDLKENSGEFISSQPSFEGLSRNAQLLESEESIFLLCDDIYKISETGYQKINKSPLITPLRFSQTNWIIDDGKVVYIIDSIGHRIVYYDNGNKHFNLQKYVGSLIVEKLFISDHYCILVTDNQSFRNDLLVIDLQTHEIFTIEQNFIYYHGLKEFFVFNRYLYFSINNNFYSLHLDSKTKELLLSTTLSRIIEFGQTKTNKLINTNGGIYSIDLTNKIVKLNQSFEIGYTYSSFTDNDGNVYSSSRDQNNYFIVKYDGNSIRKIYNAYSISFYRLQPNKSKYVIFNVQDSLTGIYTSRILDMPNEHVLTPITKNDVQLDQVYVFNGVNLGIFSVDDSIFLVKYNDDFSAYTSVRTIYHPVKSRINELIANISDNRLLISSGNEYLYIDSSFDVHKFNEILPSNYFTKMLSKDSVFYFIAIGAPLGHQVYTFNHERYNRKLTNIDSPSINQQVKIYPNPSSSFLFIDLPDKSDIEIYSLEGRLLLKLVLESYVPIDISSLPNGAHIIQIMQGKKMWRQRFAKI
jgi:hypothetical protein